MANQFPLSKTPTLQSSRPPPRPPLNDHSPLIYLLRFRTKETIAALLFLIFLLSAWYVSGIRQPILKWLGLPIF